MSRWLSSVNNFLETLDDQVENVRDVLTERHDMSDDEEDEYYTTESDVEEGDDEEEQEINLVEEEEDGNGALFPPSPPKQKQPPGQPPAAVPSAGPTRLDKSTEEKGQKVAQQPSVKSEGIPASTSDSSKTTPASSASTEPAAASSSPAESSATGNKKPTPQQPVGGTGKGAVSVPVAATAAKENSRTVGADKTVAEQTFRPAPNQQPTKKQPQPPPTPPPPPGAKTKVSGDNVKAAPSVSVSSTVSQQQKPKQPKPQKQQPKPPPPQQQQQQRKQPQQPRVSKPPSSTGASTSTSINTNNKQQVLAEMRQLRKQVYSLQQELNAANKEIKAQQRELDSAATIVERERQELKEEKEELLEDHEEEMEHLKTEYEEKLANLKAKHRQQLDDIKYQLSQEKAERQQEGGDLNQDLHDALERERDALQEVASLQTAKSELEVKVQKLTMHQEALQEKLETSVSSQSAAVQRQQDAERALDDALEQHKRQLKQRQVREAELERTIAELGTALTAQQQQAGPGISALSSSSTANGTPAAPLPAQNDEQTAHYKEQWELAMEEVENLKGQLRLESQRCEALRRELGEVDQERNQEAAGHQERQRQYDQKLEEQASTIARLEATIRDLQPDQDLVNGNDTSGNGQSEANTATVQRLQKQLEESKLQVSRLSEQFLRQQGMTDVHKSEILALKGRLQAANARAEEAEKTTFQSPSSLNDSESRMYESEGSGPGYAGYKMRRRVKGRGGMGTGGRSVPVRSIRTALNMGPGTSMEGLGKTIEALDVFMIDTGAILRHEPLARLAFFLYFSVLHLWCFCLVAFHSTETVHGDFPASLRGGSRGMGINDSGALQHGP